MLRNPRSRFALLMVALFAAGCRPAQETPPAPSASAPAAVAQAPVPVEKPARDHPAPVGTPDLDRAETDAAKAPSDPAANRALAFCYYKIRAYKQATPAWEKVASLAPNDPAPLFYLGYTQMAIGDLDAALATFNKILARPDLPPAETSEAHLQVGNCLWAKRQDDAAAAAFTKSLGAESKKGLASLALGTYAAVKGRPDQAHDFFADAARDLPPGPDRAQAWACLGRLAQERKDTGTALKAYKQALTYDKNNTWAKQSLPQVGGKKDSP